MLLLIFLSCVPFVHSQETYTLIINVVDGTEDPITGVFVQVIYMFAVNETPASTFPKQTNASGFVEFTIQSIEPSANITVSWLGTQVAFQEVNLSPGTSFFTVTCDVSDVTILTLDGKGRPLQGAEVKLDWNEDWPPGIPNTRTTDNQGLVIFPQMPYYSYPVSVKWQDKLVHEDTFDFTSSTTTYVAECKVYDLTVNVVDREDRPISEANVTVTRSDEWETSKKTDNGVAAFTQLATENYSVEASFLSSSNTTTINLLEDTEVFLKLNISVLRIFEVKVKVVWSDEKPVSEATVTVQNNYGQQILSGITDVDGTLTITLSEGAYIVKVVKNTLSTTKNITVTDHAIVPVTFDASLRTYTLTIEVIDDTGVNANNAVVELYQNGNLIDRSETLGGTAVFNVKQGTYKMITKLNNKQREEIIEVKDDVKLVMSFYENNPITLLLTFLIMPMLIVASVGLLIFHFKRRKRLF